MSNAGHIDTSASSLKAVISAFLGTGPDVRERTCVVLGLFTSRTRQEYSHHSVHLFVEMNVAFLLDTLCKVIMEASPAGQDPMIPHAQLTAIRDHSSVHVPFLVVRDQGRIRESHDEDPNDDEDSNELYQVLDEQTCLDLVRARIAQDTFKKWDTDNEETREESQERCCKKADVARLRRKVWDDIRDGSRDYICESVDDALLRDSYDLGFGCPANRWTPSNHGLYYLRHIRDRRS
ncbi:hypothetical protein QBC46DRAFT_414408 [Diplogelasinospora grovesii]|uniref:Uncharacterized protein n=1 Tax=Diplogelasinospora grovesii TaxID=303347 RepID=A0AAN6MUU3_9PEZI|nr:hypothetical protein QBC46DRAFT_414408 [Diplogelasinospora grovesii]